MPEADSAARPSADDFLAIIRHQQIGKLKIYIGPSPGVGKTYAMLNEGRRFEAARRRLSLSVTSSRTIGLKTSAQIGDLEIVPPRLANYHGITLKEMDGTR
jgi:two-component system sensor histidine kinase KdpD